MKEPSSAWKWAAAGALLLIVAGIGGWFAPRDFFGAWLTAWLFWSGLSLGALVVFMLQCLTGGAWAKAVERPCLTALRTISLAALGFLPILAGARWIYPWTDRELFAHHHWPHKEIYLSPGFFTVRALIYFAVFAGLAAALVRAWNSQPEERRRRALQRLSCAGLVLYFVCMNFAATDWVMSLTPEWYSTIFPVILMSGQFLSALALLVFLCCGTGEGGTAKQFHDLGNLLLAFVVFWTYVSIGQLILIWSGNLPREITWYLDRWSGGWQYVALVLLVFQFLLPFGLLLGRELKRDPRRLARVALLVAAAGVLNVFWLVKPSLSHGHFSLSWLDVAVFLGLGGVWIGLFLRNWQKYQPVPEVARHG